MRTIVLVALLGLGLGSQTVKAGDGLDCHSLPKWEKDKDYKEGSLVWAENQDWHSAGAEYRCEPRSPSCHGSYEPKGESMWKLVGNCKSGTKP